MIDGHQALAVGDFGDGHLGQPAVLHGHHLIEIAAYDQLDGTMAELRGQHPVVGGRYAAALNVPEDCGTTFQPGPLGNLLAENLADPAEANGIG